MVKKKVSIKIVPQKKSAKRVKKKEAELTRLGGALRMLGGLGGRTIGSMVGYGDVGAQQGTNLAASISRWLGSGDYSVSSNSLTQRVAAGGTIPAMHKEGQTVIVRHKEFISEVLGSTTFKVQQQFNINPGLSLTFPWLAGIAAQFSEYRIRGMVYHYVPTSGDAINGTNPAIGSVMLQTSYRASESAPTSKIELLNEYWSSEAKPSEPFCHPIECDPKENPFNVQYIRTGSVPAGDSVLMYDLGKTTLAVSGMPATNNVVGDLWVTYEIELRKPILTDLNGTDILTLSSYATSGVTASVPFGTNMIIGAGTSFAILPIFGNNTITFPAGSVGAYQVVVMHTGATSVSYWSPSISGLGSSLISNLGDALGHSTAYTVGTQSAFDIAAIQITNPTTTTVLTLGATTLTGVSRVDVNITQVNPLS